MKNKFKLLTIISIFTMIMTIPSLLVNANSGQVPSEFLAPETVENEERAEIAEEFDFPNVSQENGAMYDDYITIDRERIIPDTAVCTDISKNETDWIYSCVDDSGAIYNAHKKYSDVTGNFEFYYWSYTTPKSFLEMEIWFYVDQKNVYKVSYYNVNYPDHPSYERINTVDGKIYYQDYFTSEGYLYQRDYYLKSGVNNKRVKYYANGMISNVFYFYSSLDANVDHAYKVSTYSNAEGNKLLNDVFYTSAGNVYYKNVYSTSTQKLLYKIYYTSSGKIYFVNTYTTAGNLYMRNTYSTSGYLLSTKYYYTSGKVFKEVYYYSNGSVSKTVYY